jgi:hypothetical protein
MDVELHCDSCHVSLRVPCEAAGHRARCPSCGHEFTVPGVEQLLEDTVSGWIEHDVEEVFEDRDRELEERARIERERHERDLREAAAAAKLAGSTGLAGQETGGNGHRNIHPVGKDDAFQSGPSGDRSGQPDAAGPRRLWPMRAAKEPSLPDGVTLPDEQTAAPAVSSHDSSIAPLATSTASHKHKPPYRQVHTPVAAEAARRPARQDGVHRYPSNLHVEERIPHLVVTRVDAAGVRFAFDSAWLNHDGFRASMPVRCVFSGSSAREKLIARPLVFMDRATGATPPIERINAAHENRQIGDHTPRQIMRMMGQIEGFLQPFASAMPVYVSNRYAHLAIHCQTRDRTSGGITCEVLIPDAITALDWLARVNGVCGKEYELLEHDVGLRHGDAWQQLSEECRQRIVAWCKLGSREVLLNYFSDADFGKRDEGLAGLVVTDHRLVFSKYHHRGQVRLDNDDTAIIARPDGQFVNLTLRVGKDLHRMVKVHRPDVEQLARLLKQHGRITLEQAEAVH